MKYPKPTAPSRRKVIAGLAGAMTAAAVGPALAQISFGIGGGGDRGRSFNLNNIFSGLKAVFAPDEITEEDEIQMGAKLFPNIIGQSGGAYANRRAQKGLRIFAEDLMKTSARGKFEYEIVLINNNTVNAWALPGGKIGVHKGLLRYTENESQLAAVIAHEVGHVEMSHGAKQMSSKEFAGGMSKLTQEAIFNQKSNGIASDMMMSLVQDRVMNVITTGYSKPHEFEADLHILRVFEKTGHNPAKATDFFTNLLRLMPPATKGTTSLFSTHPGTEERIQRIQAAADGLPTPEQAHQANGFKSMKRYFPNRRPRRRS
jgi:predicted Zn-dependent protease